ncbi:hypothetical protein VNO80_07189 [Phaseolus coccineus]|uniref:Uncharacterized protein n=1 Tax=Phaseolus coccineus TaxID=3886 RepID=A0AAN9NI73_PHACN
MICHYPKPSIVLEAKTTTTPPPKPASFLQPTQHQFTPATEKVSGSLASLELRLEVAAGAMYNSGLREYVGTQRKGKLYGCIYFRLIEGVELS